MSSLLSDLVEATCLAANHLNRLDVDGIDRLNYKHSFLIFAILAAVAAVAAHYGDSIRCSPTAEFVQPWFDYIHSECWASGTYYVPKDALEVLPSRLTKFVNYYQWVPFSLMVQAMLFHFPSLIWRSACGALGYDLHKISKILSDVKQLNPSARDTTMKYLVRYFDRMFLYRLFTKSNGFCVRKPTAASGCGCGKRYGNTLVAYYVLTKVAYVSNAALQLYVINHVFSGWKVIDDLIDGHETKAPPVFPRQTVCLIKIRAVGENQTYLFPCVLPMNMYYEKLYIFIWLWLAMIVLANVWSLLMWVSAMFRKSRKDFVAQYLKASDTYDRGSELKRITAFCDRYLRLDGHLMLRMIGKNTNYIVIGDLTTALWLNYYQCHTMEKKISLA